MTSQATVLETENLKKYFEQDTSFAQRLLGTPNQVQAVDDVSLSLERNTVEGVIGESGCGKSTLLMTMIGLNEITDGEIRFRGEPITSFSKQEMKTFRSKVQIIFQDPFNALDPKLTVEESMLEPLKIHGIDEKMERIHSVLEDVELDPPEKYLTRVPSQLSGGELQRVSIGRALAIDPDILLADEPLSMLDVSTQASILNLLSKLIKEYEMSMFYVSHDLSTVSYICDRINVMYLGRIVESAPTKELLENPKHPYTQALINAVPIPDPHHDRERTELEGQVPDPVNIGEGCRFRDRCPDRMEICEKTPVFYNLDGDRNVACHLYYDHETYPEDATEP